MDLALAGVAETLASEFAHLHSTAVVRVLDDCVDEFPCGGPHFVEQAARARLSRLHGSQARSAGGPERCSLDVSLHDDDLANELDLMASLIVAANGSDRALAQEEIDEILGVTARGPGSRRRFPTARVA